jgi:hypothetical protein
MAARQGAEQRPEEPIPITIYVDADACPVKEEVYRVARRYGVGVTIVANSWMRVPKDDGFQLVLVEGDVEAADDWIAEHVAERDIVVTADIPLADRCLKAGARVLGPRGRAFTHDSIGEAVAARNLSAELRDMGIQTRGPDPFDRKDRSRFLQTLDAMLQGSA